MIRPRRDRMRRRAIRVQTAAGLRADIDEIARKLRDGDWTINRARAEMGLRPLGPVGDETARHRPNDLAGAMAWYGIAPRAEVTFPPTATPDEIERWQRAWDETMADSPVTPKVLLPPRGAEWTPHPRRQRKSPPRGIPRMRKHRRELLINALRWDGPYAALKAYRFLPNELGLDEPTVTAPDVQDSYVEHVIEPTMRALPRLLGLPDGIEFQSEPPTDPTETDPNGATDQ